MNISSPVHKKRLWFALGKVVTVVLLAAALIFSGKFTDFMTLYGLIFILLGAAALALMSYSLMEIGDAFKYASGAPGERNKIQKSAFFWQSATRNAWMLGVLGSIINFVVALSDSRGGISETASRMATSYVTAVYGMILAVICFVPSMKLTARLHKQQPEKIPEKFKSSKQKIISIFRFEHFIGYFMFIAVVSWAVIKPSLTLAFPRFKPLDWILYWPSFLVVLGGTIILVIFVANSAGKTLTISFALTGLLGSFMGFIQVLLGIAGRRIENIASAATFVLSSCFIALLGMMLLGGPLEDRWIKTGKEDKYSSLSQVAWYVFPLVILIILVLTFVIVVTPMEKKL